MKSKATSSFRGRLMGVIGGLVAVLLAVFSVSAQAPSRSERRPGGQAERQSRSALKGQQQKRATAKADRTTPGSRTLRSAPSLAVLMAAYEGVLKNDEKANPEIVRALKLSFEKNPSARQTIAKIHRAYQALNTSDREKIVGQGTRPDQRQDATDQVLAGTDPCQEDPSISDASGGSAPRLK